MYCNFIRVIPEWERAYRGSKQGTVKWTDFRYHAHVLKSFFYYYFMYLLKETRTLLGALNVRKAQNFATTCCFWEHRTFGTLKQYSNQINSFRIGLG